MAFCSNCGVKINEGARFCESCGKSITSLASNCKNICQQGNMKKIYKCPNCGGVLNTFDVECHYCGYELRGTDANNALKELAVKLEIIDSQPDTALKDVLFFFKLNQLTEKEKQKISLIRNFPIPNTREDLYEFLIMAEEKNSDYNKD